MALTAWIASPFAKHNLAYKTAIDKSVGTAVNASDERVKASFRFP